MAIRTNLDMKIDIGKRIGDRFIDFHVIEEIGKGSYGTIFKV